MVRSLKAVGLPSGAATLRSVLVCAVTTTGTNKRSRSRCRSNFRFQPAQRIRCICSQTFEHYYYLSFLLSAASGADASQHIRPQKADRKDNQGKGYDQVDQVTDDRANLEVSRTNLDTEGRDALAGGGGRREERHKDTVIQRLEERRDDTSEVKRSSQNDDVLSIEHLLNQLECF